LQREKSDRGESAPEDRDVPSPETAGVPPTVEEDSGDHPVEDEKIVSQTDGPYTAQKGPFVIEVQPGTYAWCACGLSEKQPYCDGSHKPTSFKPIIEKVEETKTVAWCGCKQSAEKPFCDGTHNRL
jgi:CDGSH-type Zn-finger protein